MPSKSYIAPETSTTWTDSGGDKLLDLGGLATASAKVGAYLDRQPSGTARADIFEVEVFIDAFVSGGGNPTVGNTVDLYFTQSNATTGFDGVLATDPTSSAEGSLTDLDSLPNLLYVGSVTVYQASETLTLKARFVTRLTSRYVAPVIVNRTGRALKSSSDAHKVVLIPIPQEGQ